MKACFAVAAIFLISASIPALAEEERMSDGRYIAASRCLAYTQLPQLSGDTSSAALNQAVDAQHPNARASERANAEARDVRLAGRRAGDDAEKIQLLRARRDEACAGFVESGLLQAAAPSTAPAS